VVYQLVDAAQRGESVQIKRFDARADWLYVDDAADALCRLVASEHMDGRVFNLSSGRICAFGEVVDAVAAVLPLQIDGHSERVIDGGPDRPAIIANDRIRQTLGWEPRDLVTGVRQYIASLRQGVGARGMHTV
jgi:nucleoside-diphosphate-sugar epimerase